MKAAHKESETIEYVGPAVVTYYWLCLSACNINRYNYPVHDKSRMLKTNFGDRIQLERD